MKPLIAIAGGIGCGKSVVSHILTALGYRVYDSDSRAKTLMDNDNGIKAAIACEISPEAITPSGQIDRKRLGAIVFADKEKLQRLNSIVHGAVKSDIAAWRKRHPVEPLWVESAIIYESGISEMVDEVWEVTAPEDIRINRVVKRNNLSPQEVKLRIAAQAVTVASPHERVFTILNDDEQPLLPQVLNLLSGISR